MPFRLFPVDGDVRDIEDFADLQAEINQISHQWEDERIGIGTLFIPVLNWTHRNTDEGMDIMKPWLNDGGRVPLNINAARDLGIEVYGPCYVVLD